MKHFQLVFSSLLLFLVVVFSFNCENDYPTSLWNANEAGKPQPIISEIIPADSSYAGISEIIIKGQNFSTVPEENLIFFSGNKAKVTAATATQLTLRAPKIAGENLEIKIAVHGAELFSEPVAYKLKPAVSIMGNLADNSNVAYAIAVDNNGNIYVSIEGNVIKKIDAAGKTTHFADVTFLKASSMKFGPNNNIYASYAAGRNKKIATITPDGTETAIVSVPNAPEDFDFDAAGNIWVTGGSEVYVVKSDNSITSVKTFPVPLKSVRVFNNYLYVSEKSTGLTKIWRAEIQGETLGAEEMVFDVASIEFLAGRVVNTFTFSEDGKYFFGTNYSDAIVIHNPEGNSNSVLYTELIGPDVVALTWSKDFIYAVQQTGSATSSNVLKIKMFENGAPYNGRP